MKLPFLLLGVMWIMRLSQGMIGYDCGTSMTNITTVSLLEVEDCDIPSPTLNVTSVRIQLLQINDYSSVHVRQCKVEISRDVRKCGMFSHTSDVANGKASYVYEVSRDVCLRMYEHGSLQIEKTLIMGISGNHSVNHPITMAGQVTMDGACKGSAYSDPFGSWDDVLVLADVKVTLRDYRTAVALKTNKIFLKSGIRCEISAGQCVDMEGGNTFWDPVPVTNCGNKEYGILYEGMAKKGVERDSRLLYTVTTSDVIFALLIRGTLAICGQNLVQTEHPKLFIYEVENGQGFLQGKKMEVINMDMYTYVNSKFVYTEKHIKTQIQQVYHDLLLHKCELEREMLKNRLAIATQTPDEFAYHLMKGPGYMAVISGEVVHIIKCVPKEVRIQQREECYTHLPVTEGNNSYFLAPKTHILMKTGMQITCNKMVAPMYFIDGDWYGMMPGPILAFPPEIMKPATKPTWTYKNINSLATSGVYTSAELDQLREHIMFPAERPAVLNTVARGLMGKSTAPQGGSFAKLLEGPELQKMMENAWKKMLESVVAFGNISAGLIGIIMIIRAIKLIIDTLIHGYALHTVYGWSLFLIGAIWDSVTNLLLHLKNGKNTEDEGRNQICETIEIRDVESQREYESGEEGGSGNQERESKNKGTQATSVETGNLYPRII